MMNNRNCSRRPINFRNTQNTTPDVSYYNYSDMKENPTNNLEDMPLAMAYVPYQQWRDLYSPNQGFNRGTIFKELDLPFTCAKGCK